MPGTPGAGQALIPGSFSTGRFFSAAGSRQDKSMSLVNQQIRALAERVAASHGLEVVDLEFAGGGGKHRTLRIFLERDAAGRAVLEQRLAALRGEGDAADAHAAEP